MPQASQQEWFVEGLSFECTQCGNCCTGPPGYVWFNDDELVAMADFLNVGVDQFLDRFGHRVNGRWTLNEQWNAASKGYDCVFLRRDEKGKALCSIYSVRPGQCRTWPFWPENLKSHRAWRRAARHCPGMNNGLTGEGRFYPADQIKIIRDSNVTL